MDRLSVSELRASARGRVCGRDVCGLEGSEHDGFMTGYQRPVRFGRQM